MWALTGGSAASVLPATCQARLTLTSGVPVTTVDVTSAGTLYCTPYLGNQVALYSGTSWSLFTLTERSLDLTGVTVDTNYDVFVYNNAGTLTLERSAAWTSNTARFASGPYATALPLQDGIYVKSTNGTAIDTTRRYLGTIRGAGANSTLDTATKRFVWNCYNRVLRQLVSTYATGSWSQSTAGVWRAVNGDSSNRVEFVRGLDLEAMTATNPQLCQIGGGSSASAMTGIGLDRTNANDAQGRGGGGNAGTVVTPAAYYSGLPGLGYHSLYRVERVSASVTWYNSDFGVDTSFAMLVTGMF